MTSYTPRNGWKVVRPPGKQPPEAPTPDQPGRDDPPPPPPASDPALTQLLSRFQELLHLPDTGAVEIVLAAYLANILPGGPVWLVLVGPPAGGKSLYLNVLE